MKPTKFEKAIGYRFRDQKLKRALLHHSSSLHTSKSYEKYGYVQNDLAKCGDYLLEFLFREFFQNYQYDWSKIQQIKSNYVSNAFLTSCLEHYNILQFHKTSDNKNLATKTICHRGGTFFEAIIWGIYIDSNQNMKKVLAFCNKYYYPLIRASLDKKFEKPYLLSIGKYTCFDLFVGIIQAQFNNKCTITISHTRGLDRQFGNIKAQLTFHTKSSINSTEQLNLFQCAETEEEAVRLVILKATDILKAVTP
jgi:hypothetical protein